MSAAAEREVWVGGRTVGVLCASGPGRFEFSYDRLCPADGFVSLTMPVRREPYDWHELHPVFEAALPLEPARGALADRVARLGEAGPFASLDRLRLHAGRWQLAATPAAGASPAPDPAWLEASDARPGFAARYAAQFATDPPLPPPAGPWLATALDAGARYHADLGDGALLYNALCAYKIAARAGFELPAVRRSADGRVLALARPAAGTVSEEDLCSLQGLPAAARFTGSIERLASVAAALAAPLSRTGVRRELFRRYLFSRLIGDTGADLRQTTVVYTQRDDVRLGPLAAGLTDCSRPVGDPALRPAVAVNGERRFALAPGTLRRLASHCALGAAEARAILDWLGAALDTTRSELDAAADPTERLWLSRLTPYWQAGAAALNAGF